jgi:hypothetical protein
MTDETNLIEILILSKFLDEIVKVDGHTRPNGVKEQGYQPP